MIRIEDIDYTLKNEPVLSGLNLEIHSGEILGITGPGGCGKSAFLEIISGEAKSGHGRILFDDNNLQQLTKKERAGLISYLRNRIEFNPESTLFDEILGGRIHLKKILNPYTDNDRESTISLTVDLGIKAYSDKRLKHLPFSMQKLCILAKTFNSESAVTLLDNPETGLDLSQKFLSARLIRKHVKKGDKTIIIASSDIDFLVKVCDRLVIMKNGKITGSGGIEIITETLMKEIFGVNTMVGRNLVTGLPEIQLIDVN